MGNRVSLLAALGVDNFGSGLFLPVVLLYVTRVVGLPLATAGTVVAVGTTLGLAVPPVAGRLVDRIGPRLVVVYAQLVQAAGAVTYLVARDVIAALAAALLLAAGQLVAICAALAIVGLRELAGRLPAQALRPEPAVPRDSRVGVTIQDPQPPGSSRAAPGPPG
jgi:MFS family permease